MPDEDTTQTLEIEDGAELPSEDSTPEQAAHDDSVEAEVNKDLDFEDPVVEAETKTDTNSGKDAPGKEGRTDETDSRSDSETEEDSGFDEEILARAERVGMPREDALEFGSAEALEHTLDYMDRKFAQIGSVEDAPREQGDSKTSDGKPSQQEIKPSKSGKGYDFEFDEDVLDEDIVKSFKGMRDHYESRIGQLENTLDSVMGNFQAAEVARVAQSVDKWFDGLGEEWHELFGSGPSDGLEPDSPQMKARQSLVHEAGMIQQGYIRKGYKAAPIEQVLERAKSWVHKDKEKTIARKEVAKATRKRSRQSISRTSRRRGTPAHVSPETAAVLSVKAKLKEFGVND